jgi:hypothetical protein
MTSSIYRYPLEVTDFQTLRIPSAHTILSVAPGRAQHREYQLDLWAKVSASDHNSTVAVYILGTGHPFPTYKTSGADLDIGFVGTCVMDDGLVWHVFTGKVKQ